MSEIPVWLDCDPGHDDALALLLACALPHFNLIGVSTVFGNASLENTTSNAMSLLTAYHHIDTPVFPGAEKPLMGFLHIAESIHGQSGLDGTSLLPLPLAAKQPDHTAVAAMAEAIQAHEGELAIVATGPLTNIALLVLNYPEFIPQIKILSIMGGGVNMGNWTKHAEYNIWSDPKAAEIVLSCQDLATRTVLVPINLTHQMIATPDVLEHLKRGPNLDKYTVFRQMMYELLTYFADTYRSKFGFNEGPPVHDPVAMAVLLALYHDSSYAGDDGMAPPLPNLGLHVSHAQVRVVTEGSESGRTIMTPCDASEGIIIAEQMEASILFQLLSDSIIYLESA